MNRYMYWQSAGGNTRVYLLETFIIIIICCHNCLPIIVCYLCRYMLYGTVGCYVGNYFVGALAYADDIALLAPSASAMRRVLLCCDRYASDYNIIFNASKSKCIHFSPKGHNRNYSEAYQYSLCVVNLSKW